MISTIKYQWLDVAGVYLIDNGMTIGSGALLAIHAGQHTTHPIIHIHTDQVSVAFTSITTLRVIWHMGKPIEKGSLIYNGAYIIVEGG